MTTTPEWPVAFFDDDYLRIYRPTFTPERTAAETDFIERSMQLPAAAAVLDLACGYGRHAIGMARRGYRVTGLDFNPRYLEIAGAEARAAGVDVRLHSGDMREMPWNEEFDGVYSYFTSFGYFSDDDNESVLAGVARALKPGGCFLLDVMNRDWLLTHPQQRTWNQREDGALLMEETEIDLPTSHVITRQMLIAPQGGPQVTKEFRLRAYTCAELSSLMRRQGLRVGSVLGGAGGEPYSTDSRRLVLVSRREG